MESIKHIHKDVVITRSNDGELVVTSRQVAEDFGKQHQHVTQAIENLISENSLLKSMMMESEYTTERGRKYKEYLLTRDGFSLLVMGFTGSRALEWKLKYIEAFNKMEQAIKNPYGHLSKEVQAIFALDHKQQQLEVEVKELKDGMPLFNVECKELQALVRKKGIEVLGGKGSQAYKNNSLRGKVYADIQHELKREFQVTRYEAIKRCQLIKAREIIADYKVPFMLKDEIIRVNNQINFKDVV
ncbi:ORF6C domain-containing protein [Clostridium saudiense]|uniref:ORF6C domain-containing protein n=1 Tax=Clostridium saudiense TaxID=1414720 RepID=UPI00319E36E4